MTISSDTRAIPSIVIRRYVDAYRHARFINLVGFIVQLFGILVGLCIAFGSFKVAQMMFRRVNEFYLAFGVGILLAVIALILFLIIGLTIRVRGQTLLATLDSAVHSSPFLTSSEKASAMKLQ